MENLKKKSVDKVELSSLLKSVPIKQLLQTVETKVRERNLDILGYINAIFQGSKHLDDDDETSRFETFKFSLSLLKGTDLSFINTSELVSVLMIEADKFETSNLAKLGEFLVSNAKDQMLEPKVLYILPRILSILSVRDSVVYYGVDTSGAEIKKTIIRSLFQSDLNVPCIIQLATVINDIDLSEEEVKLITKKFLAMLPEVELSELPSYVYQLLLFSKKGQRTEFLQGILSYFISEDNKLRASLAENESANVIVNHNENLFRQIQGTVILLTVVASRQDQGIGKEFIQFLRTMQHKPDIALSPFSFAIALSLSKVQRYEEQVFDALKGGILMAFRLTEKQKQSSWLRSLIPWETNVLKLVEEAIKNSQYGWDHVCQGLVNFGFAILESCGPKYVCGKLPGSPRVYTAFASEQACILGCKMLRDTFKIHHVIRAEIFEQILNKIITKSLSPISHYVDALSQTVQGDPQLLLEILSKLIEIMDVLPFIPHVNACGILKALTPLLKISMPLKDTLMLVLRKALFHKDIEARKVAVTGYLTILKKISSCGKISLSQSQTSLSSQSSSSCSIINTQPNIYINANNANSKMMCLEIMGLLKRALMQQAEIRQLLYEGLYEVAKANPALIDIILELLLSQFEIYYSMSEDATLPINFDKCIQEEKENLILIEPISHLITSIQLALLEVQNQTLDNNFDDDYDISPQTMLENTLKTLTKRMAKVEIENFGVTKKDADDILNGSDTNMGLLLMATFEALMEFSLLRNREFDTEACEELLQLHHQYKDISDLMNKKKQLKNVKINLPKSTISYVTLEFTFKIMHALFIDSIFSHQQGLSLLRKDNEFVKYILITCNQKLARFADAGSCDGFSHSMDCFSLVTKIGKIFLESYANDVGDDFVSFSKQELSLYLAEGLSSVFSVINNVYKKHAEKFVIKIDKDNLSSTEAIQNILKLLQKSVIELLSNTDDSDNHLKVLNPLLSIISSLYSLFPHEFVADVYKWIKQLCLQQALEDMNIAKTFVSLYLSLSHQDKDCMLLLKQFAYDLRYHIGSIDADNHVTTTTSHEIVNPKTSSGLVALLISHSEQILDEVDWVLNFMKSSVTASLTFLSVNLSDNYTCNLEKTEQEVCLRLSGLVHVFHNLVQTAVAQEFMANNILKLVTRFYKTLITMTKYYLQIYQNKRDLHISFEKLIKLSGTRLTPPVYMFLTYRQTMFEEANEKKGKAKSKTGSLTATREVKTIPLLIFSIESYEKNLIMLSKKTNRNLMAHMKLSTARDFRIDTASIKPPSDNGNEEPDVPLNNQSSDADEPAEEADIIEVTDDSEVPAAETHEHSQTLIETNINEKSVAQTVKQPTKRKKTLGYRSPLCKKKK